MLYPAVLFTQFFSVVVYHACVFVSVIYKIYGYRPMDV